MLQTASSSTKRRAADVPLMADPNYTCGCCCNYRLLCVISHHSNRACASLPVSGQTKALWTVRPARAHVGKPCARVVAIIIGTGVQSADWQTDRQTDRQGLQQDRVVRLLYIEQHRPQSIKLWHSAGSESDVATRRRSIWPALDGRQPYCTRSNLSW